MKFRALVYGVVSLISLLSGGVRSAYADAYATMGTRSDGVKVKWDAVEKVSWTRVDQIEIYRDWDLVATVPSTSTSWKDTTLTSGGADNSHEYLVCRWIEYRDGSIDAYDLGEAVGWKAPLVKFKANGGTGTMASQFVLDGSGSLQANAFTRSGYEFWGWSTSATASVPEYYNRDWIDLSADAKLYAVWVYVGPSGVDTSWREHVENYGYANGYEWGYEFDDAGGVKLVYVWPRPSTSITIPAMVDGYTVTDLAGYTYEVTAGDDEGGHGLWREVNLFDGCASLRTINFPNTLKEVHLECLQDTAYWKSLPNGPIVLGALFVSYKGQVPRTFTIPNGVQSISKYALRGSCGCCEIGPSDVAETSQLKTLNIPASVTWIGSGAFSYSGVETVNFSGTPTYIGYGILDGTPWMRRQPEGLVTVANWVLGYHSLKDDSDYCTGTYLPRDLVVPEGVYGIAPSAFYFYGNDCDDCWDSWDGTATSPVSLESVILPSTLKAIGDSAFWGNRTLVDVTVPASVKRICTGAFVDVAGPVYFMGKKPTVYYDDTWASWSEDSWSTVFVESGYSDDDDYWWGSDSLVPSVYYRRGALGWIEGSEWEAVYPEPFDPPMTLSLAAATVKVSEDAGFVDLVVNRTSTYGSGSLWYETEDGTATAGEDYYPTSGELFWSADDTTPRTIRIRLLSDVLPKYEGTERFYVNLLADGELVRMAGATRATVKLTESKELAPGTVAVEGNAVVLQSEKWEFDDWGDYDWYPIELTRTGGCDGRIAVRIRATNGTAIDGTSLVNGEDFYFEDQVVVWEDGDDSPRTVYLENLDSLYWSQGRISLKLYVMNTEDYADCFTPSLALAKVPVSVEPIDDSCCVPAPTSYSRTFSVSGPSIFFACPHVYSDWGEGSVTYKVSNGVYTTVSSDTEVAIVVPSGRTTITFKSTDSSESLYFDWYEQGDTYQEYRLVPLQTSAKVSVSEGTLMGKVQSIKASGAVLDSYKVPVQDCGSVTLHQGVNENFYLSDVIDELQYYDDVSLELVGGSLPPGMKLKNSGLRVCRTPTATGSYTALFRQVYSCSGCYYTPPGQAPEVVTEYGPYYLITFEVDEIGFVAGNYRGLVQLEESEGYSFDSGLAQLGQVVFSATSNGTLSASVTANGRTYSLATTGFSDVYDDDGRKTYYAEFVQEEIVDGGCCSPSLHREAFLELSVSDACPYDYSLGEVSDLGGAVTFTVQEGGSYAVYRGELFRRNNDIPEHTARMSDFAGYYTVSLVPDGVSTDDGVPCGNGYLTFKVKTSGKVTGAGRLADGTDVTFSTICQLRGDLQEKGGCVLYIPVFVGASDYALGGMMTLNFNWEEVAGRLCNGTSSDSGSCLFWNKDGKYSSYDRLGFRETLRPCGGYYNTLYNLEAYYYGRDFTASVEPVDGIPSYLLPSGHSYSVDTMPRDVGLSFTGNALLAEARSLVVARPNGPYYDLAESVNPWKVKTSLDRTTGLVTGTFRAWSDNGYSQSQFATINHYGVHIMHNDGGFLSSSAITSGFCLLPVTSKWTLSLPFVIQESDVSNDDPWDDDWYW